MAAAWSGALSEVFVHADRDVAISHPSPGTVIACYELLLALCYAAGVAPENDARWTADVEQRASLAQVAKWLWAPENEGRFNLFDKERPFGQHVGLSAHLADHGYSPVQLVLERAKDYNQFADHVHLSDPEPMTARDAFLAMITQHAYGLGGRMMTPASIFGDPFTRGAVGRLGARVRVLAIGDSIADTLRLNLRPTFSNAIGAFNATWTDKERRPFRSTRESRQLEGPADWHSVLGRSILLRPKGDQTQSSNCVTVDRVLLGAGEMITPNMMSDHDAVYVGGKWLQASLSRALWRDAHAIYGASLGSGHGQTLFDLIARLTRPINLLAVGLDATNSKVAGWVRDVFPYNPRHKDELHMAAERGAMLAEEAVQVVRRAAVTARRYFYPRFSRETGPKLLARFDASDEVYARAGALFHQLLRVVADGTDPHEALRRHAMIMHRIAVEALDERLRPLPPNTRGWRAAVQARDELLRQIEAKRTFKMYLEISRATS